MGGQRHVELMKMEYSMVGNQPTSELLVDCMIREVELEVDMR